MGALIAMLIALALALGIPALGRFLLRQFRA
jgi:hypothetical protein